MNKYIIAEVDADNQILHRGELFLDEDFLSVVGSGSTADVFAISQHQFKSEFLLPGTDDNDEATRYVAKIWRELPIADEQVDKLRFMVRNKLTYQSTSGVVWPEYVLFASPGLHESNIPETAEDSPYHNDMVVGYIMPRVSGAFPLHQLIDPVERALLSIEYKDMRFLYHVSMNIARSFYALHKQQHVMGDVNPTNILVTTSGEVLLIDCDSFQIQRNFKSFYPANKHSSSYKPLSKSLQDVSVANDLCNMASLIFQLLMQGAHPFGGQDADGNVVDSSALRSQRIFPFLHPTHTPLTGTPSITCLPKEIQDLCVKAFTDQPQNPPSAVTWVKVLIALVAQLVPCKANSAHYHIIDLPCAECEWQKHHAAPLPQA